MRGFTWADLSARERTEVLARPARRRNAEVVEVVRRIFDDVERDGWNAVCRWGEALNQRVPYELQLTTDVVARARAVLAPEDLEALELAIENVRVFHERTKPTETEVEVRPGVHCQRVWRPIEACGLYAPGGETPLFSTLIMLAIPARVAGVPKISVATPPSASGAPKPIMIAAAAACGLDSLWVVGGAQAIAAMTYGVGMPKVDKIFGPGSAYVAEAKRLAAAGPGGPAIDVPAGPSELMVIADGNAEAAVVAADLLSQAEHDADAQVLFVSTSSSLAEAVERELERQMQSLPRADIARRALVQARSIVVSALAEAAEIANAYAPEHLSLQVSEPAPLIGLIDNAGAIFVGAFSAETFGDYICGPSHVLPTDGAARAWSGVSVGSFMKSFSVQSLDRDRAKALSAAAARLARLENLEAHARAADIRTTL